MPTQQRKRIVGGMTLAAVLVLVVVAAVWTMLDRAGDDGEVEQQHQTSSDADEVQHPAGRAGPLEQPEKMEPGEGGEHPIDRLEEEASQQEDQSAGEAIEPVQPSLDAEGPEGVGPEQWMAPADDVDEQAIDRQFEQGRMEREQELAERDDRRRSIVAVSDEIDDCYPEDDDEEQWRPDRRLALEWKVVTEGGVGTVQSPQILERLGGEDEAFEVCVIQRLDGLQFDAGGDGAQIGVRWGYFPD